MLIWCAKETVDEVMRFYGHNKRTQSKSTHRDETTERRPTETHNPEPDISSEVSPEASSDEDEDEDEDTPSEHTPEPNASESGKTVSTKGRSTKGRSILRPRRNEIPLEPSSPDDILDSPIEKHLKRRHEPNDTITVGGSSLKRQILSSPPAESRRSSRPPELSRSKLQVRPPRILGDEPYWTCTLDMPRCKHVIANAKTREGRHAIELHYEFHGKIMSDAMETLGVETQAHGGGYQVDNLMRKIQEMSQRWEERKPTPLKGLGE